MIPSIWPKTILFGQLGASLKNGRKTGFPKGEIARGFWPAPSPGQNAAPGGPLRPRVYPRSADHPDADPCPTGIRRPPGLEDRLAGERNRLGCFPAGATGATAGGRAPPGDRRRVSVAAGPLGPVRHGSAGDSSGTGASGSRVCLVDGGAGSDDAGWSSHGRLAGSLRRIRAGDPPRTGPRRAGTGPPERPTPGSTAHGSPPCRPSTKVPPRWH